MPHSGKGVLTLTPEREQEQERWPGKGGRGGQGWKGMSSAGRANDECEDPQVS